MNTLLLANWIKPSTALTDECPIFKRQFKIERALKNATLYITALGVYEATINQKRIGEYILAPGWTSYNNRIQYQAYNITDQLDTHNELLITVGKGWCLGRIGWESTGKIWSEELGIIATIKLEYTDNTTETIITDTQWQTALGPVLFSEIYDGEIYDARITPQNWQDAVVFNHSKEILVPQDGEIIKEIERVKPIALITTPKGETVIDFGQNLTGYVEFTIKGNAGDIVQLSHAEVFDQEGNFYTDNLRGAKQNIKFICSGDTVRYKPHFTFQGFRYIRLDSWTTDIDINDFCAIVVHSDIKRTGYFECSNPMLNQLFKNIIWGQKGNFLDVPTDCPQRDERLGWTGDAQVFIRAAAYNFDVSSFFTKWLRDLRADQFEDGGMPHTIPNPKLMNNSGNSAAWADAAVICPWQMYLSYGNKGLLAEQYDSMAKWVNYIRAQGDNEYLWNNGGHVGDWLALDAVDGRWQGSTDEHLIATAFFAYSTSLLIKAGRVLGKDVSDYEMLHRGIVSAFQKEYMSEAGMICNTQTAHVLALYFDLANNKQMIADNLAKLIIDNGNRLTTGFVGTPYLLHVLSDNGYADLAYTLLLREEYPSWLYPITKGATTIWEHWDGIRPDGSMWNKEMNSFNHYAYGAVADWMYAVMAGINIDENAPAFEHIIFRPITDTRLEYVRASIESRFGLVASQWTRVNDEIKYSFNVPPNTTATIYINGDFHTVGAGEYHY